MDDSSVAELLSIPDPHAAAFNPANGVRRSMRNVKSRVLRPDFVDQGALEAQELTDAVHPIATEAKTALVKRLRSPLNTRVKSNTSSRTEAPEPTTPAEDEITRLESPLKKARLRDTPKSSSAQIKSNIEVHEDESMAGESDQEFVPPEVKIAGTLKTPQVKINTPVLATPPSSDESQTPSPKKRGTLSAKRPKRTPKTKSTVKLPETAYDTVDPVEEDIVPKPAPHGKPMVWAEV